MAKVVSFDFAKNDFLSLLSAEEIGSSKVDATPVTLELKPGMKIESADVVVTAASALDVQALNSADDVDQDGVWHANADRESHDGALPAMLVLSDNEAWLKYRLEGTLKASVAATLAQVGFQLDAQAGVIFGHYRVHGRTRPLRDAVLHDVTDGPRVALDLSAVEALAPHEALTFQARGRVVAKISVAFSDLFTAEAATLITFAGVTGSIGFKVQASASVDFDVAISDEFIVSFTRVDDANWRFGVRKAKSRQVGVTVAAGIEVSAADSKALNAFLAEIKDALLAAPLAQVQAILKKGTLDRLSDAEKALVKKLAGRFGLSDAPDVLSMLQQRIDAVDEKIEGVLKQVAESKIKLGFAYEYARLNESIELLQATVDRSHLQTFHGDLIRGRLQPLLNALTQNEPGLTLDTYLNQQTLKRERSWGFSLGIGKWVDIGGRDTDKLAVVRRKNFAGAIQESYLGTRGYQGKWVGETFSWSADFRADMRNYSQGPAPLLPEFDLGLHLAFETTQKRLSPSEIDDYLDFACLWGIVAEEELPDRREQLLAFKDTTRIIGIQLTIPDEAFRILLPVLVSASDTDLAGPLAAAMPRRNVPGMRTVLERAGTFRDAWKFCLANPNLDAVDRRRGIVNILRHSGHPELAMFEDAGSGGTQLGTTVSGRIGLDDHPIGAWREFRNGAFLLAEGLKGNHPAETILDRARRSMRQCWTQVHRLRAIGTLLCERAVRAGVAGKIGRTMLVTPPTSTDANEKAMVLIG